MDEWELSKENIQPLVSGRQMTSLKAALTPIHDEITQKQNQYEQRLRFYTGNDELQIWHEYISWAEQYFPQGGKQGNYDKLICQCVKHFQNETQYYNDDRFVSVILKYIKQNANKLEVFNQMEVRGIGRKSARFYCEWAWQLEQFGNYQKANEILSQAIYQGVDPKESLLSMQKNIVYKLSNKINSSDTSDKLFSSFIPESVENRQVLSGLQPVGKKNRAPTNRVATITDSSLGKLPGQQHPLKPKSNVKSTKFAIYSDDEQQKQMLSKNKAPATMILKLDEQFKENEQKAGKWRHQKITQGDKKVVPIPIGEVMDNHTRFNVHTDDGEEVPGTPKVLSGTCGILKLKPESSKATKSVFDPPTPNKISKYNHALVYGGAKEMCFEEIRAASWYLKQQRIEEAKALAHKNAQEEFKKTIEALRVENDYMKQQLLLVSSGSSQNSSAKTTPDSLCFSRLKIKDDASNSHNSSLFKDSNHSIKAGSKKLSPNKSVTHDVFNLWNASIGVRSKNSTFEDSVKNHLTPENLGQISSNNQSSINQERQEPKLGFQIFKDCESPDHKLTKGDLVTFTHEADLSKLALKSNQCAIKTGVYVEASRPANFVIFEDFETKSSRQREVNGFTIHCDEPEDDYKENESPSCIVHCENKRPLAGILVESETVHFLPLEEQEDSDDDRSEEEELAQPLQPTKTEHYTMYQEERTASSKMSSTPFPFTERSHAAPKFPIDDGFTITLEPGKTIVESTEQSEFVPPQTKETKKNVLIEHKTNRMSLGVGLSPIMEGSREQSKSSSSSGYTTSHTNGSTFGMKSMSKSGIFKAPNNSVIPHGALLQKKPENEPLKPKLSRSDVFLTVAYNECLKLSGSPIENIPGYSSFSKPLPNITPFSTLKLGEFDFEVLSCAGKGGFASVYKAIDEEDKKTVALKINRKPNEWEFYITSELQKRLENLSSSVDVRGSVLHYHKGYFFKNGSVLISEYSSMGSLLDFINGLKSNNLHFAESLIFYFTWELMRVLEQIHKSKIIHADIKPDNILLMKIPDISCLSFETVSCLCLIDFGQAIDLSMYDEGITFNKSVRTSGFQCPEMLENRPWTFQPDLYGLLACVHIMLFSKYMEVVKNKKTNLWETKNKIKRYWKQDFWNKFFITFLNIQSCEQIPSLVPFIEEIQSFFIHSVYISQLQTYLNKLRNNMFEK